jgi:hypothetical protein
MGNERELLAYVRVRIVSENLPGIGQVAGEQDEI